MNQILMVIMAAGAVVGGIDRMLGNKWGFCAFAKGIQCVISRRNFLKVYWAGYTIYAKFHIRFSYNKSPKEKLFP